jgi:monofunctional chorismate mutase
MKELREEIDVIDQSMQNLFLERMQVVKKVAEHKADNDLPVLDEKREQEIMEKNLNRISDLELRDLYKKFYKQLLDISKEYQERIIKEQS